MRHQNVEQSLAKLGKDETHISAFCGAIFRKGSSINAEDRANYLESALKRFDRVGSHTERTKLVKGFGKELIDPRSTLDKKERTAIFGKIAGRLRVEDTPTVQKAAMQVLADAVLHRNISQLDDEECHQYVGMVQNKVCDEERHHVGKYAKGVLIGLLVNGEDVVSGEDEKESIKKLVEYAAHPRVATSTHSLVWDFNRILDEFKMAPEERSAHLVDAFANAVSEIAEKNPQPPFLKLGYEKAVGYKDLSISQ